MNYFNWEKALLNYYKDLDLNELDVTIILLIDFLSENETNLVTPDLLAIKSTLKYEKVDDILDNLTQKNYVKMINKNGKVVTTLETLKKVLFELFIADVNSVKKESSESSELLKDILKTIEANFARPLSFVEVNMVREWLNEGYTKDKILFALKEAISKKIKSINYIDKILLEWKKQEEKKAEGYTTITDKWKKDISESNIITDLNWVEKKDV